jgi:hypothetical protein
MTLDTLSDVVAWLLVAVVIVWAARKIWKA